MTVYSSSQRWVLEPPIEVVRYEGVITLWLEESSLTINSELPPELVIRAILTPPEWTMRPWSAPSPEEVPLGVATDQLERWALQKFKALFDFAAAVPDGTASEIEHHLLERFPLLRATREAVRKALAKQDSSGAVLRRS